MVALVILLFSENQRFFDGFEEKISLRGKKRIPPEFKLYLYLFFCTIEINLISLVA